MNEKEKSQKDFGYNTLGKLSSFQLSIAERRPHEKRHDKDEDEHALLVNYYYDALGRRVAKNIQMKDDKKIKSFTQKYIYLADEEKILIAKNGKGEITQFIDGQGIDEHLGEVNKKKAKSYITDHLGSVLNTEASDERKMFAAFGDQLKGRNERGEAFEIEKNSNPVIYGFAGREYDLESGLYYNRARMYNPTMGRFISKDPIGFNGGDVNLYRYVGNNPQGYTDPSGNVKVGQLIGGTALIIGGAGLAITSPATVVGAAGTIVGLGAIGIGVTLAIDALVDPANGGEAATSSINNTITNFTPSSGSLNVSRTVKSSSCP